MALQINTTLTASDGGLVSSGSHVKIEVMFPMEEDSYNANMKVWRNESAYINGYRSYKPMEIPSLNYNKELTPAEMTGMTQTQIYLDAKAYLEGYVGEGNVDIV